MVSRCYIFEAKNQRLLCKKRKTVKNCYAEWVTANSKAEVDVNLLVQIRAAAFFSLKLTLAPHVKY